MNTQAIDQPKKPRGRPRKVQTETPTAVPAVPPNPLGDPGRDVQRREVPDAAFFAGLPAGFKMTRRADYLGDVFVQSKDYPTAPEKVIWLRHNSSPGLLYLLRLAFCKSVEWLIPEGLPVYKAWRGKKYTSPSELKRELRRLYLFLKGGNDAVTELKRQKLFQEVIEGIEASELEVLVAIKDHTLEEKYGLTAEIVNLAFPQILDAPFKVKFIR